jgi:hypothetical protein
MILFRKSQADILNAIESHHDQNTQDYNIGIYGSGNAEVLIEFLQREEQLARYFNRTAFGDEGDESAIE